MEGIGPATNGQLSPGAKTQRFLGVIQRIGRSMRRTVNARTIVTGALRLRTLEATRSRVGWDQEARDRVLTREIQMGPSGFTGAIFSALPPSGGPGGPGLSAP